MPSGRNESSDVDDARYVSRDADGGTLAVSSQGGSRYEDALERQDDAGSEADDEAEVSNPLMAGPRRVKPFVYRISG